MAARGTRRPGLIRVNVPVKGITRVARAQKHNDEDTFTLLKNALAL
jgi:hypothetical protein